MGLTIECTKTESLFALFVSSILSVVSSKLMGFFITTSLFPFIVLTFFDVPMSKESSDASLSERERGDGAFWSW